MTHRAGPVLDLLAEDRRAEARDALEAILEESQPDDPGYQAVLALRRLMDPGQLLTPSSTDTEDPLAELFAEIERSSLALREGRVAELVSGARRLDEKIRGRTEPHPWLLLRVASLLQAAFRFTGDGEVLAEALEACTRASDATAAPPMAVYGRALLGSLHMMSGALHAAMDRLDAASELAESTGIGESPAAALAIQFRGYVLWERNCLDEAEAALARAWTITSEEDRGIRSGVARVLATVTAAQGRIEDSDRWLGELTNIVREPMTLRNREWLAAVRLTQAVLISRAPNRGNAGRQVGLREIERWRRSWDYDSSELESWSDARLRSRLHELDHVMVLLELTGQWSAAEAVARRLTSSVGPFRTGFRLRALTVRAVALEGLARREEAAQCWADALRAGAGEGFVRSFLDGSSGRARLHRAALEAPETAVLARRVSRAADGWPDSQDSVSLTNRQLDVLRAVAAGSSNRQVADALEISESTVKTHLRAILARLGAVSRTHAVAIARAMGLLA